MPRVLGLGHGYTDNKVSEFAHTVVVTMTVATVMVTMMIVLMTELMVVTTAMTTVMQIGLLGLLGTSKHQKQHPKLLMQVSAESKRL